MDDRFLTEWFRWTIDLYRNGLDGRSICTGMVEMDDRAHGGLDCDASVDYRAVAVRPKPSTVGVTPTEIVAELT